jgi:predicted dienelactone hydrolase
MNKLTQFVSALGAGLSLAYITPMVQAQTDIVVGTATIEMKDESRARAVTSEIWFPAAPGTPVEEFSVLPPLSAIRMTPKAAPASSGELAKARPLIVISHGNWSTRYGHGQLAIELVRAGYIVLTTSHPGTMNGDLRTEYRLRLWERSKDVSFALTEILNHPTWAARIDAQKIGFAGHSFGAWTGVSLAGGRYDFARQLQACKAMPEKDQYCAGLLKDYSSELKTSDSADPYLDNRFRAFYLMAGGPGAGFTPESLAAIRVPMLLDTARFDTVLAPAAGSSLIASLVPGAREIVREVGHFTYAPICRPIIGRAAIGQICVDPDGVDRKRVHAQIGKDAVSFFKTSFSNPN